MQALIIGSILEIVIVTLIQARLSPVLVKVPQLFLALPLCCLAISSLCSVFKVQITGSSSPDGGDKRNRTADPLLAKQVLSQLSYTPGCFSVLPEMVGLSGLEPPTSRLSVERSSQLS